MAKPTKTTQIEQLKDYLALMKEHDLSELELEEGGTRIKLKKESRITYASPPPSLSSAFPIAVSLDQKSNKMNVANEGPPEGSEEVKSPMVGTFYRSSGPGKPPFVEKGGEVKKGDILCIVEAMKIMNDIKSTLDGKLLDILVENGEPVEYGQPLFIIQKK